MRFGGVYAALEHGTNFFAHCFCTLRPVAYVVVMCLRRFINALWTPVTSTSSSGLLLPVEACSLLLHKMALLQEEMTSSLHRSAFLSALVSTKRKRAGEMPDRQALLPSM